MSPRVYVSRPRGAMRARNVNVNTSVQAGSPQFSFSVLRDLGPG
jgi:hypothetical protein